MAATNPIDEYLATLDEPKRATLTFVRDTIMTIVPDAEQCISYGMPAFKLRGKTTAGFAAFKSHLSYLPHSGSVIPQLADQTAAYTSTKGSLHFPVDEPLPEGLVRKLLEVRWLKRLARGSPTGGRPIDELFPFGGGRITGPCRVVRPGWPPGGTRRTGGYG